MQSLRKIIYLLLMVSILLEPGCSCAEKHYISGQAVKNGEPVSGKIRLIDPKTKSYINYAKLNEKGQFKIAPVSPGEWFLGYFDESDMQTGEFKYVKLLPNRSIRDIQFEITEVDPQVDVLLKRISH